MSRIFCRAGLYAALVFFVSGSALLAQTQQKVAYTKPATASIAEQYLFAAANMERAQMGLPMLHWDAALTFAAAKHARGRWRTMETSHTSFQGGAGAGARGAAEGARFSKIAENVAEAPNAVIIHDAWMRSEGHRENLLDAAVDSVGIAVVRRGQELYAVEDFDRATKQLSFDQQEHAVHGLVEPYGLKITEGANEARRTCSMDTGYVGERKPWFVMRFTASELTALPDTLKTTMLTGRYHEASIGACDAVEHGEFTAYNIAVLLYP